MNRTPLIWAVLIGASVVSHSWAIAASGSGVSPVFVLNTCSGSGSGSSPAFLLDTRIPAVLQGMVTGQTEMGDSLGPVTGASVRLLGIGSRTTDNSGEFSFESITAGAYTLEVSAWGYYSTSHTLTFAAGEMKNESVTLIWATGEATKMVDGYGPDAGYSHEQHIRALADVNGDGMDDIVAFGNPGVQVATSTGNGFQHGGWWDRLMSYDNAWRVEKHPRLAADMNGDGMADIVGFGDRGVFIGFSNGSGFSAPEQRISGFGYRDGWRVRDEETSGTYDLDEIWTAAEQFCLAQQFPGQYVEHPRMAVDINGDGSLDIAGFGPQGVTVALNNGDGTFDDTSVWFAGWYEADGWRASEHVRTFADLNGDGFLDIVGIGQRKVAICLCEDTDSDGFGDAYLTPQGWKGDFSADMAWRVALHPRMTASVNGDSMADLVCFGDKGVLVSLCDGSDFLAPEQWLKNQFCRSEGWSSPADFPRGMVDLDLDGDDDILGVGTDGVYVTLGVDNTGDGHADSFTAPQMWVNSFGVSSDPPWDPTRHLRLVGDVDGDGIPEIVGFYDDGVYVY